MKNINRIRKLNNIKNDNRHNRRLQIPIPCDKPKKGNKADKNNTCFVTGCDKCYEWALPWWYKNYSKHNDFNLVFVDFGMSNKALSWCETKGEILNIDNNFTKAWFCKPIALRNIPYEYGIWIDLDCEIRKRLQSLITYANYGFAVTIDKYAKYFCKDMNNPAASGVVGVYKDNEILIEWEQETLKNYKNYRGDQEILNSILQHRKTGRKRYKGVAVMPLEMQWLRLDGDNKNAAIMHWSGTKGNAIIKDQIKKNNIGFDNV